MNYIDRDIIKNRNFAAGRWSAVGPYYAMFPNEFAYDVISEYSKVGDKILDPFAGRGTTLYIGGLLDRHCDGIEINPVGWLYSSVKLNPARRKENLITRLTEMYELSGKYKNEAKLMPVFYHYCYCKDVLNFLLAARDNLNWKNSIIDATLMVFILLSLHDKIGNGLSNQMQLTKAMGQNYSIEWWRRNNMSKPPQIDPVALLKKKIEWRYEKGTTSIKNSKIHYGDSTIILDKLTSKNEKFSLLLTSPPYYSLTDYHVDQWLRLWMLGGPNEAKVSAHKHKGRFNSENEYTDLLDLVFCKTVKLMDERSVIYVRTDARKFTKNTTIEVLRKHYPLHSIDVVDRPLLKRTQTSFFNNNTVKPGEVDIILTRN